MKVLVFSSGNFLNWHFLRKLLRKNKISFLSSARRTNTNASCILHYPFYAFKVVAGHLIIRTTCKSWKCSDLTL
jgi:hypothetical protein